MSLHVADQCIHVVRGPHWWLAWVSDRPQRRYKGRSVAEAVGRLVIDHEHELPAWCDVRTPGGSPTHYDADPLTEGELHDHLALLVDPAAIPVYRSGDGRRAA